LDEVVGDPDAGNADRRSAPASADQAGDPGLAHEPLDALATDVDAAPETQLGVHAPRTVDLAVLSPDLAELLGQPRIRERPIQRRAGLPRIEARSVDVDDLADQGDRETG